MLRCPTRCSKSEDRLNHWFAPENSADPELDRGPTGADTPHNFVASATWNMPGSGPVLSGLAPERRRRTIRAAAPYTIRYAGDPTGGGLTGGCSTRGCQSSQPGARNTARGEFINYTDVTLARTFAVGSRQDRDSAPTCSTCSTTRTCSRTATSGWSGTRRFGQHTGGANVFPGRQFQFAATYRF